MSACMERQPVPFSPIPQTCPPLPRVQTGSLRVGVGLQGWGPTSLSRSVLDSCICFSICDRCSIISVFS